MSSKQAGMIYVAGGSSERIYVAREWMRALRERGWEVTHDWTESEGYDKAFTFEQRTECGHLDLLGVSRADVVWVLVPEEKTEGQAVELGYALALHKPIVISGPRVGRSVFHGCVQARFPSHLAAFAYITTGNDMGIGYAGGMPRAAGG